MATATSTGSGSWSGAIWSGGSGSGGAPADGDDVVIAAGHSVLMDSDLSAWTGLFSVTIQGHATTPAMLYFKDGTNGYLKVRTGYSIVGTTGTLKGRFLANSDGVWGNTGALTYTNKAVVAFNVINGAYLDVRVYCTQPTREYVTTYYDKYTVSSINTGTNVITMTGSHGWSANRKVRVKSTGTLPSPLRADAFYLVNSPSGADLKLYSIEGDGVEVNLTDSGSGTIEIYSGYETYTGVTTVNVFEDISSDSAWSTTTDHNLICLVNSAYAGSRDIQQLTLSNKTSTTVTLSSALDSVQLPGARIYLSSRNVSFRNHITVSYSNRITNATGWVLQCEILNTSGGTSQYLFGTNYDVVMSGVINKFDMAYGAGGRINVSGVILTGGYGFYQVGGGVISGTLAGINAGAIASGSTDITVSGIIFGCSTAFSTCYGNKLTGSILDCYYAFSSACSNECTGSSIIAGCDQIFYQGCCNNLVSGIVLNNRYLQGAYLSASNIFRNALTLNLTVYAYTRNSAEGKLMRVALENFMRTDVHKILDDKGDIYKTACDGTGDAPSIDPDGGNGYCIEASNIQSNCGVSPNYLTVLDKQRIWLTTGSKTVTYKLQTTYAGITAGNLKLTCTYIGTDGVLTDVTNAPAITTRSDDTDWSQTLAVTFTPSADGWATFKIELMQYEANDEVYVWPQPTIS